MPDFEEIIAEAIRIGNQYVTPARVNEMFLEHDRNLPMKEQSPVKAPQDPLLDVEMVSS
jgi:hypothetical protein